MYSIYQEDYAILTRESLKGKKEPSQINIFQEQT